MKKMALAVHGLTVHYGQTPVLWDVNVDVPAGKLVAILGPNGAGKSSFVKTILGLIAPVTGTIHLFGKPKHKVVGRVSYVPQRATIDWDFPITVRDLVSMGRYPKLGSFRFMKKEDRLAAEKCMQMVGLEAFADRQISELSGGQQQRAFLARAILQDADISFLDEPLSGVDIASEKIIMNILKLMRDAGKTIFMVHHDLNTVETYFDWVIFLNLHLVAAGPMADVFTAKNIREAYGKNFHLIEETAKLQQDKISGLM